MKNLGSADWNDGLREGKGSDIIGNPSGSQPSQGLPRATFGLMTWTDRASAHQRGDTTMFNKTKIVLLSAIVFSTASGAFAATKHARKVVAADAPVSASAFGANALVKGNNGRAAPGLTDDPPGSRFQDEGYRSSLGESPR
jgi:hypothetical protein